MLGIYNETSTNWTGSKINDKTVCLLKSRNYNRKGEEVRRSVHLLMYNSIFNANVDEVLESLKTGYTCMTDVAMLTDKNTTVIFSKKDYNPFMTERTKHFKDVFLISLDLKGKKVLEVSSENIFVLEGFILGGELSLITSLNNFDGTLNIKLFDAARKKVVVYTFGRDVETNKLYMKLSEEEPTGNEADVKFVPKKFRPARPTHTIIVHNKDKEQLQTVVDTKNHNVVEISKQNMDNVIQQLIDENYKAVTLFMNVDNVDDTAKKIYGALMTKLSKKFKVYYELLNTGKVLKVRY